MSNGVSASESGGKLATIVIVVAGLLVAAVAWFFTVKAATSPGTTMVETLPPVSSALFVLIVGIVVFLRPRVVVAAATSAWIAVAIPVIGYLLMHPAELKTARGLELAASLGPGMGAAIVMIHFLARSRMGEAAGHDAEGVSKKRSDRDALTGLFSRAVGERVLARSLDRTDPPTGAILFTIDGIDTIQKDGGTAAGDAVRVEVAARCMRRVRKYDTCVRWGDNEFLVIVSVVLEDEVNAVSEHLRRTISSAPVNGVGIVTASFGATCCRATDTLITLLARLNEAHAMARRTGPDKVEFL